MDKFEVAIVNMFVLLFYRILIPALVLTATIGALTGVFILVARKSNMEQRPDCPTIQAPALYEASTALKWLFRKWGVISLTIMLLTAIIYGAIFDYSIRVWNGMPPKQEFEQTLITRFEYRNTPLSCPNNLIGVQKSEIEDVLGTADQQGIIKRYDGVRQDGTEYYIKIVYLPIVQRVVWYETAVVIG